MMTALNRASSKNGPMVTRQASSGKREGDQNAVERASTPKIIVIPG
jgi:hypothetical protein